MVGTEYDGPVRLAVVFNDAAGPDTFVTRPTASVSTAARVWATSQEFSWLQSQNGLIVTISAGSSPRPPPAPKHLVVWAALGRLRCRVTAVTANGSSSSCENFLSTMPDQPTDVFGSAAFDLLYR